MVLLEKLVSINEKTELSSNPSFPNFLLDAMDTIFIRQGICEGRAVS
jgi:hypothetical protein